VPAWFEEVVARLAARPVARVPRAGGLLPAAVLVPLLVEGGELLVLLTRRSEALAEHAGQWAFPGGRCDEADEDEVATALRESAEEIGVDPASVLLLGHLDDVRTTSGYVVSPVVGALAGRQGLAPRSEEVTAIAPFPLSFLAQPELVEEQEVVVGGVSVRSPVFHYRGHRVWGATARILADLLDRLGLAVR